MLISPEKDSVTKQTEKKKYFLDWKCLRGYSFVKVTGAKADVVQNTVMDTTALDNYISNLSANTSDDADGADTDTDAADKAEVEDNTATADDKETSDDASTETTDDAATADADSTDAK